MQSSDFYKGNPGKGIGELNYTLINYQDKGGQGELRASPHCRSRFGEGQFVHGEH
jgi:hypothetical protein